MEPTKNKNPKKTKQDTPICVYDFTANTEYHIGDFLLDDVKNQLQNSVALIKNLLADRCKKWSFQLEEGNKEHRLHFQGRFSLKIKDRLSTMTRSSQFDILGNLSPTSDVNRKNDFYVTKPQRIDGPWKDNDPPPIFIPRQYLNMDELYPYQAQILRSRDEWDPQRINFILELAGGVGRSSVFGLFHAKGIGRRIPPFDNIDSVLAWAYNMHSDMYFIDMPRALDQKNLGSMYAGIETLKEGWAYDKRNTSRERLFNSPIVWVSGNKAPLRSFLSERKWSLWYVQPDTKILLKLTWATMMKMEEEYKKAHPKPPKPVKPTKVEIVKPNNTNAGNTGFKTVDQQMTEDIFVEKHGICEKAVLVFEDDDPLPESIEVLYDDDGIGSYVDISSPAKTLEEKIINFMRQNPDIEQLARGYPTSVVNLPIKK